MLGTNSIKALLLSFLMQKYFKLKSWNEFWFTDLQYYYTIYSHLTCNHPENFITERPVTFIEKSWWKIIMKLYTASLYCTLWKNKISTSNFKLTWTVAWFRHAHVFYWSKEILRLWRPLQVWRAPWRSLFFRLFRKWSGTHH